MTARGGTPKSSGTPLPRPRTVLVDDSGESFDSPQALTESDAEATTPNRNPFEEDTDARARPKTEEALVGTTLHGHRVLEKIGEGSQSRVFRGEHAHLGRQVAIKVLRGTMGASIAQRGRLLREARVLADLSHPHVVRVFDFGETSAGLPFIVLEWLDGISMRKALKERQSQKVALRWAGQLASSLATVHSRNITHRDVKPGNIMVLGSGENSVLKLIDFGLAKVQNPEQQLTSFGDVIGTPQYLAPETLSASPRVGPPADVYALGAIMYELAEGRVAFEGSLPAVIEAHRSRPPPHAANAMWDRWIQGAMSKRPEDRPTASQLFEEIVEAAEGALEPTALATMALLAEDATRATALIDSDIDRVFTDPAARLVKEVPVPVVPPERPVSSGQKLRLELMALAAVASIAAATVSVVSARKIAASTERVTLFERAARLRVALANAPNEDFGRRMDAIEASLLSNDQDLASTVEKIEALEAEVKR